MAATPDYGWDPNDCDGFGGSPVGDAFVYDLVTFPARTVRRLLRGRKNGSNGVTP